MGKYNFNHEDIEKIKEMSIIYTISEISKCFKVSHSVIKRVMIENSIPSIVSKFDSKNKPIYQNYDWLYDKYVTNGMSTNDIAKLCSASNRVIKKWVNEKYKITTHTRKNDTELNNIQHDIVIGSLLGDGHIDKRDNYPIFIVSHAENQKDYLYWKYNEFIKLCNKEPSKIDSCIKIFGDKEYLCQNAYRMITRSLNCFIDYRNMSKSDVINNLNELSFSVFILDDGSRYDKIWSLCVASLSNNEKELLINKMNELFNINGYLNKDIRYMSFRVPCSKIIDNIILKNIPNELDIIKYKILGGKSNE